jgi:hypothetical protein
MRAIPGLQALSSSFDVFMRGGLGNPNLGRNLEIRAA